MKAPLVTLFAMVVASVPIVAVAAQEGVTLTKQERRVCTRIQLRGASRVSYQRICRTPTEWRDALGADWRQLINGQANVEDDLDKVDVLGGGGQTSGGVGGFHARVPH